MEIMSNFVKTLILLYISCVTCYPYHEHVYPQQWRTNDRNMRMPIPGQSLPSWRSPHDAQIAMYRRQMEENGRRPFEYHHYRPQYLPPPVPSAPSVHHHGYRRINNDIIPYHQRVPFSLRIPYPSNKDQLEYQRRSRYHHLDDMMPQASILAPSMFVPPPGAPSASPYRSYRENGYNGNTRMHVRPNVDDEVARNEDEEDVEDLSKEKMKHPFEWYDVTEQCEGTSTCDTILTCKAKGGLPSATNCGGFKFCCSYPSIVRNLPTCGRSSSTDDDTFTDKIVGGSDAVLGQFPWMVHIIGHKFHCGGVLVSSRFVLTAQHCMEKGFHNVRVILGDVEANNDQNQNTIVMRIARVISHPEYKKANRYHAARYDIAIIELEESIDQYSDTILPICLPTSPINITNAQAIVSGWGRTQPTNRKSASPHLKFTNVQVISNDVCQQMHMSHSARSPALERLQDDVVCAYQEEADACQGDSGGPLVINNNNIYTLVGLVQTGIGCAEKNRPGIYHRISSSVEWISSVVF